MATTGAHVTTRKEQGPKLFLQRLGVPLEAFVVIVVQVFLVIATPIFIKILVIFRPKGGAGSTPEPQHESQTDQVQPEGDFSQIVGGCWCPFGGHRGVFWELLGS